MAKRGTSGLSLVVGVDKPEGMTSHDVVNACRRIYGERRVGHTGTLDPAASGAMAVCVGPATRLDAFIAGHRKTYEFIIEFGTATDTDDSVGEVIASAAVPRKVSDPDFACEYLASLVGERMQRPPTYSAIKQQGRKSYEEARRGVIIDLKPRAVRIHDARFLGFVESDDPSVVQWHCSVSVSGGTYVRSIARDAGEDLGTRAHVGPLLRRVQSGNLSLDDCVSLEELERDPFARLLDPVKLLGFPVVFLDAAQSSLVGNGSSIPSEGIELAAYDPIALQSGDACCCSSGLGPLPGPLEDGQDVCMVESRTLRAIYRFDAQSAMLKSKCGFAIGVRRGSDI